MIQRSQTDSLSSTVTFAQVDFAVEIPFETPELIFGLAMVSFLIAPLLLERFKLPGIIGIVLVGAAVGPDGLGLLGEGQGMEGVALLGEVGLIFLMFIAGLEINFNQFLEYKDRSVTFGVISFLIPQVVGMGVALYILDFSLLAALLFGAIFSSHTLLAYPIVNKFGMADHEPITATIGGTILTDTFALLVLAIVIALHADGGTGVLFWGQFAGALVVFFVGVWVLVPKIGRWFFKNVDEESYYEFLFVMAILFLCAILAELVGVKHIIGAFLAGLALNRLIPKSGPLMNRIEFVGNALLIPFFLLWVGTLVDLSALFAGPETLLIAGLLTVLVLGTKLVAAGVTAQIYDYTRTDIVGMYGLSVGQAAAALAIVLIGFEEGIPHFDQTLINGVVLMILVVSLLSPMLVTRAGKTLRKAAEQEEYDPSEKPRRILLPLSQESTYWENLLEFTLTVRGGGSTEPIHTISVLPPGDELKTEAEAAEFEMVAEEIEEHAAGAEVGVKNHSRVEHNVAAGIAKTAVENRISTIVIGWDGVKSRRQRTFGRIIDQLLQRATQLTLVSHIREPMNVTERVVLILPPDIHHNSGFYEAVHTVKTVAENTGAPVRCLTVGGNAETYENLFELVEPEVTAEFESVNGWSGLLDALRDDTEPEDLVALMSARRGDLGWDSKLQNLPKSISTLTESNFVIIYPAGDKRADDRRFLQFK